MLNAPILSVAPICAADLDELTIFEFSNRAFFESHINARPASYYAPGGVEAAIDAAMLEANKDVAYQFLVRNADRQLVGRVNLTRIRRQHFHSAEIGYRIAEEHNRKGYASETVRQVLQKAFEELELLRIEACASHLNPGSCAVLTRNGFTQFGRSTRSFSLAGTWHDLLHFECHANITAPG